MVIVMQAKATDQSRGRLLSHTPKDFRSAFPGPLPGVRTRVGHSVP